MEKKRKVKETGTLRRTDGSSGHVKRSIERFSKEQGEKLEDEFSRAKYRTKEELGKLAKSLGVDRKRVVIWFVNRRQKERLLRNRSEFQQKLEHRKQPGREKKPVSFSNYFSDPCDEKQDRTKHSKREEKKIRNEVGENKSCRFTKEQLEKLNMEFGRANYLTQEVKKKLATDLGVDEKKVKKWFAHRREKSRSKKVTSEQSDSLPIARNNQHDERQHVSKFNIKSEIRLSKNVVKTEKKIRHRFEKEELEILYKVYAQKSNQSTEECKKLAKDLGVNRSKVYKWFKKRRCYDRKLKKVKKLSSQTNQSSSLNQHRSNSTTEKPSCEGSIELITLSDSEESESSNQSLQNSSLEAVESPLLDQSQSNSFLLKKSSKRKNFELITISDSEEPEKCNQRSSNFNSSSDSEEPEKCNQRSSSNFNSSSSQYQSSFLVEKPSKENFFDLIIVSDSEDEACNEKLQSATSKDTDPLSLAQTQSNFLVEKALLLKNVELSQQFTNFNWPNKPKMGISDWSTVTYQLPNYEWSRVF